MKSGNGYQIKVTLSKKPPIWRRFLIPGHYNFSDFHRAIQDVMGWNESHLHEFEVINPVTGEKEFIGIPEDNTDNELISGEKRKISDIFSNDNSKAKYVYDFGDNWVHHIELEEIQPVGRNKKYPVCIQGVGACPPEDCGGLSGYIFLLGNTAKEEFSEEEFPDHWQRHLEENICFREPPTKSTSKEEYQLWMRKLLQGKICLEELKQDLCAQMPYEDIELLYDCVRNKPLYYRNRAIGILSLCKGIPHEIITDFLFISRSSLFTNLKIFQKKGVQPIISDKGKRLLKHDDPKYIEKIFSILHSPPSAYGFNRTTWKHDDIKKVMSDNNMPVCKGYVSKIIKKSGYTYRKARTVLTSNDPQYKEKIGNIKKISGICT